MCVCACVCVCAGGVHVRVWWVRVGVDRWVCSRPEMAWRPRQGKKHSQTIWQCALSNIPGEDGFDGNTSRLFNLRSLQEDEILEGMKMGSKRRAAVVKSKDKQASAQEAARLAAAEAEEKRDLEGSRQRWQIAQPIVRSVQLF